MAKRVSIRSDDYADRIATVLSMRERKIPFRQIAKSLSITIRAAQAISQSYGANK